MINERLRNIKLHEIRRLFEMADENTINLGQGQPDFQPPPGAVEAFYQAMREGKNNYGSHFGVKTLRDEIAKRYCKYLPEISRDNILVTVGGTQALRIIFEGTLERGDEVLYPEPGFVLFRPHVELAGGKAVPYQLTMDNDFVPSVEELDDLLTPKTKAVIFNSPSNPTGGVIPPDRVEELKGWARENELLMISDEVYDRLTYDMPHTSFLDDDDVVVVNSFSKTYAMTGWRIGYMITRTEWIQELGKLHSYNIACPPHPTQYGALHAMLHCDDHVKMMVSKFKERRDVIVDRLNRIDGFKCIVPRGAFYVFPSFDLNLSSQDLALELLREGLLTTPGSAFGPAGEGHLRLSYANSIENIDKGMDILEQVASRLSR